MNAMQCNAIIHFVFPKGLESTHPKRFGVDPPSPKSLPSPREVHRKRETLGGGLKLMVGDWERKKAFVCFVSLLSIQPLDYIEVLIII